MSGDGPIKVVPEAEPLDDIILGEDDETNEVPPVAPKPANSEPPRPPPAAKSVRPKDQSANRIKASEPPKELPKDRKRSKLTLRIPDDEVSRPQLPPSTPPGGIPALRPPSSPEDDGARVTQPSPMTVGESSTSPLAAGADISADDTLELAPIPAEPPKVIPKVETKPPPRAPGIDVSHEPGWTPSYQPPVASEQPIARNGSRTVLDVHEVNNSSPPGAIEPPSSSPMSEEIPIELETESGVPETSSDEVATNPRLPTALDSEEIKIEETDRVSDPADAPEVDPEDLVSVESLPAPKHKTMGKYPAFNPARAEGITATSLMAGVPAAAQSRPAATAVTPATPAVTPQAPPVAATPQAPTVAQTPALQTPSPTPQAPSVAPTPPGPPVTATPIFNASAAVPAPAGSAPHAAKRPSSPIFLPPVGALAPPPMTETAAMRKKTRPWWEELFNDDFIRTMAKVTDAQIAAEVDFVEESLGCEAGAMILDLACGTGRHAVELATRGYQVVGFDLSLAMLARASDEAQDRKQKINFVQGDMREMTFEETFDGIYSWNTSFGYFDEEKNGAVIARVHKALKKGGQFLLDVVNRDYIVRQAPSLAWFEGDGCICMDEMTIDFITSRMRVKRTLMMDDGRTKEIEYSIRVYALHELGKMLHDNGFRVAEVSGRTGTPGVFFGCESPRTLILAEKR
jgi:SAM-dependent methyltransferase